VRLNPPQKVWEKCMEYRTEEENGDAAWYKLIGNRNTPVKVVHTANIKWEYDLYNM
jgi:hypothetical protein